MFVRVEFAALLGKCDTNCKVHNTRGLPTWSVICYSAATNAMPTSYCKHDSWLMTHVREQAKLALQCLVYPRRANSDLQTAIRRVTAGLG